MERLRIIVLGYLVRGPLGGLAWHHLQYVLGLAKLGHDVYFLEDSDDYPSCYDPDHDVTGLDPAYGLAFAAHAFERLDLHDRWAYHDAHRRQWLGPAAGRALERCATADVVLNLSGVAPLRPWWRGIPVRILVDTDPLFTQVRHLHDPAACRLAAEHTAFFSYGENVGQPQCRIPADGFPWRPTRQPIVAGAWTRTPAPSDAPLTSVMVWASYAAAEHEGRRYGMKAESFEPYLDLPLKCRERFEIGFGGDAPVQERLRSHGWTISDSRDATRDPWTYQQFLTASKAEFSVAKHGYVASRSGWFSERSAAYLASGRPVIVQDTGFSTWLRADGGVLPFSSPDEALARIDALNASFAWHCQRTRDVIDEYFDFRRVLPALLSCASDTATL